MELDVQRAVNSATRQNDIELNGNGALSSRPPKGGEWSESARRVLNERYLIKHNGVVVETPDEMCWRVASAVAEAETRWTTPERVREYSNSFYDVLVDRK